MSTMTDPHPPRAAAIPPRAGRPRSVRAEVALVAALTGAAGLLVASPSGSKPASPGRVSAVGAWQHAQRADIPAHLPDGPVYQPIFFLDARTSIGTAASPDGRFMRLILRAADGSARQLRRLPLDDNPFYESLTVNGDDLAWAETAEQSPFSLWTINLRAGTPARRLTADAGPALFYNTQYDLAIADGRLHWAAAGPNDAKATEIRSIPLTGAGAIEVHTEPGSWALSAWPWLVNGVSDPSGTTLLRNISTNHDITVADSGGQTTCTPTWCRVVATASDDTARIDVMHPDGTARRRVAGGKASSAIDDVAVLDRFEVLSEPSPTSDLTGTAGLLVYDITTRRTIDINPDVGNASYANGVLWYSTGIRDAITWHTLDLRTI